MNRGEDVSLKTLIIVYVTLIVAWLAVMIAMIMNGLLMGFLMNLGFLLIELLCVSLFMINTKDGD